jgi:hypothetical protein
MTHPLSITFPREPIVIYTAITGNYDSLKEQPRIATHGANCIAFVDRPYHSRGWQTRPVHAGFDNPRRNAKIHKVLPHVYFPDAQYSLWIDGSVTIRFDFPIERLIEIYLADCDLAVFQHRRRTCIYQEASVCLQQQLDTPDIILRQIGRYTQEGYPSNAGLAECPILLRRHTAAVNTFNEVWWEEIQRGSIRDQLSFPYVVWKTGLRVRNFSGTVYDPLLFYRGTHARSLSRRAFAVTCRAFLGGSRLLDAARVKFSKIRQRSSHALSRLRDTSALAAARSAPGNTLPLPTVRGRKTVALGPVCDVPSWHWVGFDTARELLKYYDVVLYDAWSVLPDCDVLFVVKGRPPDDFVAEARSKSTKLVYCPVDFYQDPYHLAQDAVFLRECDMVLVHCERLLPLVQPYCSNIHFIEHHTRFALKEMSDYKDRGYILWIGGCQYVSYLLRWLACHPIGYEIRILTNIDNYRARHEARHLANDIGVKLRISRTTTAIAGCRIVPWSERLQDEMMRECKAALDVKMTGNFNQDHKPPTKAQQYVASSIPFAVNPDSSPAAYFRTRGFEVASPEDTGRWLSREYWEETRIWGERLRGWTSLEAVGWRYRQLIESL